MKWQLIKNTCQFPKRGDLVMLKLKEADGYNLKYHGGLVSEVTHEGFWMITTNTGSNLYAFDKFDQFAVIPKPEA